MSTVDALYWLVHAAILMISLVMVGAAVDLYEGWKDSLGLKIVVWSLAAFILFVNVLVWL